MDPQIWFGRTTTDCEKRHNATSKTTWIEESYSTNTNAIMSIESFLCRQLDIAFIDARVIKNEAMVALELHGYPATPEQRRAIQREAIRIFYLGRSENDRMTMRRRNWDLESFKIPTGSMSVSDVHDSGASQESSSSREEQSSLSSWSPKRILSTKKSLRRLFEN